MAGIALLGILTVLFGMGIYVSVSMGLGGLALVTLFGDRPVWDIFGYVPWNTTTSFTLVALPLFVLMGEVLLRSGVTEGMYSTLGKWLNPLPGGLLHSNIAACAMFACISGSSAATAATIGGVSLPFLKSYGYSDRIAAGSLVAGGSRHSHSAEHRLHHLWRAGRGIDWQALSRGFVPGFLMAFAFMCLIALQAIRNPSVAPKVPASTWRERLVGLGSFAADPLPDGARARHHLHGRRHRDRGGGVRCLRRLPDRHRRTAGISSVDAARDVPRLGRHHGDDPVHPDRRLRAAVHPGFSRPAGADQQLGRSACSSRRCRSC